LLLLAGLNTVVQAQSTPPATTLPPTTESATTMSGPVAVVDSPRIVDDFGSTNSCNRVWGSMEYLLWWMSNGDTPPLVTTGDPLDPFPGALGQPGTRLLFGGNGALDNGAYSGGRLTLGAWLNDSIGVEASGFLFEQRGTSFAAGSDAAGNPPIYVPILFVNRAVPGEGSYTIADPNLFGLGIPVAGNIAIGSATKLWGTEINGLAKLSSSRNLSFNALVGYRYLSLDDSLSISGSVNSPGPLGLDFFQTFREGFSTQNAFHGVNLGGAAKWNRGRFSVDAAAKIAFGWTQQIVNIDGTMTVSGAGAPVTGTFTNQGTLFVFPSNVGRQTASDFTVVPQVTVKAGVNVTNNVKATVGYDFLYWSSVVRAGDQIDRAVNDSQAAIPAGVASPLALPAPKFDRTGFFAHGLNFGVEFTY
jgi:hypothetical protein